MQPQGASISTRSGKVSGRHLVSHVEDFCHQAHKQQADLLRRFTCGLSSKPVRCMLAKGLEAYCANLPVSWRAAAPPALQ